MAIRSKTLLTLPNLTQNLTSEIQYFTILFNKGKVVRYIHIPLYRKLPLIGIVLGGRYVEKNLTSLPMLGNALKYGICQLKKGKMPKPYRKRPFADIRKHWLGNFIQKLTFKFFLTGSVIFGGEKYSFK
jgi:hypothetical protein